MQSGIRCAGCGAKLPQSPEALEHVCRHLKHPYLGRCPHCHAEIEKERYCYCIGYLKPEKGEER